MGGGRREDAGVAAIVEIVRIEQHRYPSDARSQLLQQLEAFLILTDRVERSAGYIGGGPCEIAGESGQRRFTGRADYDRDCGRSSGGRVGAQAGMSVDDLRPPGDQLLCESRKPLVVFVSKTILERNV